MSAVSSCAPETCALQTIFLHAPPPPVRQPLAPPPPRAPHPLAGHVNRTTTPCPPPPSITTHHRRGSSAPVARCDSRMSSVSRSPHSSGQSSVSSYDRFSASSSTARSASPFFNP